MTSVSSGGEALAPELERRLKEVEEAAEREPGFVGRDWLILAVTGVLGPIALLLWGWPS
ncbi:MAG: hypothetical protein JNL25_08555 [Rhodospirillaceae bacterium]|nr:hypothetical protein [Rhodospirillaceae bacterium]